MNLAKQWEVNIQKLKAFLYTNNVTSETESRKKDSICYRSKKTKVPRNKPNQEIQDLYSEYYTTLNKEIKEDTNKWKHLMLMD